MSKEEKRIEENTEKLFNKNMDFLKKNYEELYERIIIFSDAFKFNDIKPSYILEYVKDDFNILNIHTNKYLYPDGVKGYNNEVRKYQNFKHTNGFNTLNEYAYSIQDETKVEKDIEHLKNTLVPFTSYLNKNMPTEKKEKEFIYIKKFIAIGSLLGFHLGVISKYYNLNQLLLIEPNLEIFRLSLFTFDYEKLSKKCKIFFSIAEDNTISHPAIERFFARQYTHNYFIKFHMVSDVYKEYLQSVAGVIQYMSPFNFDHLRMLKVAKRTAILMSKRYKILNLKKHENVFENLPVIIIASGPSLKYNIEWLEKNKNKFVIVAVAGSIPRLTQHNIKPDIIVSLEAYDQVKHRFEYIDKKVLEECIIFLSSMSHSSTLNVFDKEKTYIYEVLSNLKLQSSVDTLTATNVGEMSFALMLILGVKNLYLLGTDAAFDSKTGASHDEVTAIGGFQKYDTEKVHELNGVSSAIDMNDVVITKGNFRDTVKTARLFYNSVLGHGRLAELYKEDNQNIYNLSDGAYFRYTIPLPPREINFLNWKDIDKHELHTYLEKKFDINSTKRVTLIEKSNLINQINFINNLIDAVESFKKIENIENYEAFELMRLSVALVLTEDTFDNVSYLSKIFSSYFQIIETYINYFFNDKNLRNVEKHINKVHKIWSKEVLKILIKYKKALELSIK